MDKPCHFLTLEVLRECKGLSNKSGGLRLKEQGELLAEDMKLPLRLFLPTDTATQFRHWFRGFFIFSPCSLKSKPKN